MKYYILALAAMLLIQSCKSNDAEAVTIETVDSVKLEIEDKVTFIIDTKDSMTMVPSLRFAKGENETYTAKMYGKNQLTQFIREERISNEQILGRNYYYHNGNLIFIKEEGSIFDNTVETYTERLLYFKNNELHKSYEKHQYSEDHMFDDTLFVETEYDLSQIDMEKPYRALQQQGEFAMYFDQFLIIEPQSYLIVENSDKTINAALYIVQGDSLLNELFEDSEKYKGDKLMVYHSFKDMNGVERMLYEGAVLLEE